ncbi:hypothetical protein ACIQB4_01885 [Streptomyces griseoluteus]|uniref:hypothetical protein n=1 Tax=Streptomyces griseoluteus TaxID=29306 RepID=UPI0038028A50
MEKIELEKQGRILSGFYEGYFVKLHDDSDVTGGYCIYLVNDLNAPTDGGDYWVEDMAELTSFVESSEWTIEWLE